MNCITQVYARRTLRSAHRIASVPCRPRYREGGWAASPGADARHPAGHGRQAAVRGGYHERALRLLGRRPLAGAAGHQRREHAGRRHEVRTG